MNLTHGRFPEASQIAPAGLSVRRTAFDISTLQPSIASLSDVFTSSCHIKLPTDTLLTTNDLKIEVVADYLNKLDKNHKKIDYIAENYPGGAQNDAGPSLLNGNSMVK